MLALTLAAALAAPAAPPATAVPAYASVAVSPDGQRVAAVESFDLLGDAPPGPHTGKAADPRHGTIVIRSTRDGAVLGRIDPCAACTYAGMAWSADGRDLAFVASGQGTATLDVARDGKARVIASVKGIAQTPRWSPDGRTLALLATPGARKQSGATQAGVALVGEIGETPDEERIAVAPAAGGPLRFVSSADTYVYEYDWTPDGRGFAVTAAKGDGDNNWWIARLQHVDLAGGEMRDIAAPKLQMDMPRVSPDGGSVAFIGGLMSDYGPVGGDVYLAPAGGGEPVDITAGFKGSFNGLEWRGGRLIATALVGARTGVFELDPAGHHAPRQLWSVDTEARAGDGRFSFSADGAEAVAVEEDFAHAPRLVAHADGGASTVLTHDWERIAPVLKAHDITWKSGEYDVQGWLLEPLNLPSGAKHPMVVVVHGGPSSATEPGFVARDIVRELIEHGYYVFEPNPRGSYGQGEAFTRANIRDFGGGDLKDILAGVDAVERDYPVDDQRLGIYGHSYGGFMTMWTVTHSQRFKAAVAGAGIVDWISYYGQNGINQWMIPFFGASAYDDPKIYLKLSPLSGIKDARTPTFAYVGERDVECPAAQSLEFFNGMQAMGVPTSLVIYPGEGHGIRDPEHKHDLATREIGWFDKYLK